MSNPTQVNIITSVISKHKITLDITVNQLDLYLHQIEAEKEIAGLIWGLNEQQYKHDRKAQKIVKITINSILKRNADAVRDDDVKHQHVIFEKMRVW